MTAIIHVDQDAIRDNAAHGRFAPVMTVDVNGVVTQAHEVLLVDDNGGFVAKVVYRPHAPLEGGATVWIETDCDLKTFVHEDTSRKPNVAVANEFGRCNTCYMPRSLCEGIH